MAEARVVSSITEVGRDPWEACFGGALEAYDYLQAVEEAGLPGFEHRYAIAEEGGRILAVAPGFFTDYRLETTLGALGRRIVGVTRRLAPRAFTVRMACLGSPCTEDVRLGFANGLRPERRPAILRSLLSAFEAAATDAGCWLLAVKDAPEADRAIWRAATVGSGYQRAPGMPTAVLPLDGFADMDGYLASLSRATRKDMRRKLKAAGALRIEVVHELGGLEHRVLELYRQTRARSDLQFEDLTAAYFSGVLARMGGRALCVLYWLGEELVACNLLLQDGATLLDKFFCMETARGPALNLYFVSWFTNVRLCLERGLHVYQSGQAAYGNKLRLGSRLAGADLYFRHRRPLVNLVLAWAAPRLGDDPVPGRAA